jgi:hypothetical protein
MLKRTFLRPEETTTAAAAEPEREQQAEVAVAAAWGIEAADRVRSTSKGL